MQVKFFLSYFHFLGTQKLQIQSNEIIQALDPKCQNISKVRVIDLIHYLNLTNQGFKTLVLSDEKLKPNIIVLKNGRNIEFQEGINTEINEMDVIAFFPPVGGG